MAKFTAEGGLDKLVQAGIVREYRSIRIERKKHYVVHWTNDEEEAPPLRVAVSATGKGISTPVAFYDEVLDDVDAVLILCKSWNGYYKIPVDVWRRHRGTNEKNSASPRQLFYFRSDGYLYDALGYQMQEIEDYCWSLDPA